MLAQSPFQNFDQIGMHESEMVWNIEADDFLLGERFTKFTAQPIGVTPLHDKNKIGPTDVAFRHFDFCAVLRPG